jgi:hypothetical protein
MGIRGELFSTKVLLEKRTYFFNVKENRMGDIYLNIVESKNNENGGGFKRQSIILFAVNLSTFLTGFESSLKVLEKEVREKQRKKAMSARNVKGNKENNESGEKSAENFPKDGGRRNHQRRSSPEGELFSTKVQLPNRTYFFNVKESRTGDICLNIVESKNSEEDAFKRQMVFVYSDDLSAYLAGLDEAIRAMEKLVRDKQKTKNAVRENKEPFKGSPREGSKESFKEAGKENAANTKGSFPKRQIKKKQEKPLQEVKRQRKVKVVKRDH